MRSRYLRKIAVGLVVLFSTSAALLQAQQPSPKSLLLRISSLTGPPLSSEPPSIRSETLVFRDGLVIETVRDLKTNSCIVRRGQKAPSAMAGLQRLLAANNVRQQKGNCGVTPLVLTGEVHYVFTWFGRGQIQNTFRVGDEFPEECPASTRNLLSVFQFIDIANAPDTVTSTTVCLDAGVQP